MPTIQFESTLAQPATRVAGEDWTFLRLPQAASDQLQTRNMSSVEGTFNGVAFATTLIPDGEGGHWMRVEKALQTAAGCVVGELVRLEIAPVAVQPEPEVPEDLWEALQTSPSALATWQATTAISRRDWIQWIISGRKAETRGIRIGKALDMLSHGKRRVCCFDRSGMAGKNFACPTAAALDDE